MSSQVWAWSPRLSLQHPEIDATHQEFVTLCSALSEKESSTPYLERLDALIEHSIAHFEQENTWCVICRFHQQDAINESTILFWN